MVSWFDLLRRLTRWIHQAYQNIRPLLHACNLVFGLPVSTLGSLRSIFHHWCPQGINTSAPGTVQWAGGMINWSDPDYTAAGGHFAAVVNSLTVQCGSSSNTTVPNTPRSYVYSSVPGFLRHVNRSDCADQYFFTAVITPRASHKPTSAMQLQY
jgi:hypothetical protein